MCAQILMKQWNRQFPLELIQFLHQDRKNICTAGADLLKDLVEKSAGRITIQVGSGVNADVIRELQPKTGAQRSICPARLLWTVKWNTAEKE